MYRLNFGFHSPCRCSRACGLVGGGLFVRVFGVLQFRFSFCSCFCFVYLFFLLFFFVVSFSTINKVVAGEKL